MALAFADINNYGLPLRMIGEGSYGQVWITDRNYVLKIIQNEENVPSKASLFEIVSPLKVISPYVISLIDVNISPDFTVLILPLANGSLDRYMTSPALDVKKIITQLCLGVADIHNANLLHLDLKPENILLHGIPGPGRESEGNIWIADLGLSRIHTCAFPPLIEEFFTLYYRSPEIALGGPVTAKGDVWAIGVIMAELLLAQRTGSFKRLFRGITDDSTLLLSIVALLGSPGPGSYLRTLPGWTKSYQRRKGNVLKYFSDNGLSLEEINIILRCLTLDYNQRPSVFEILQDPWFGLVQPPVELTCRQALRIYEHSPPNTWSRMDARMAVIIWLIGLKKRVRSSNESLSLAIYLFDRWASLFGFSSPLDIQLTALAGYFIGVAFYDAYYFNINDTTILGDRIYSAQQLATRVNDILRATSFDLAVTTSYIFLSQSLLGQYGFGEISKVIWQASLLTSHHFSPPEQVADDILSIADERLLITSTAINLIDQILDLPVIPSQPGQITISTIIPFYIRDYLIERRNSFSLLGINYN